MFPGERTPLLLKALLWLRTVSGRAVRWLSEVIYLI